MILVDQPRPILRGGASLHPLIFGTSDRRARSMRNKIQILRDDPNRCEENLYKVYKDDARLTTSVCLSVAYIWPKSITKRHIGRLKLAQR